jgi:hypothetical protein
MNAYATRQTPGQKRRRFYTVLGRIDEQDKTGDTHGSAVNSTRRQEAFPTTSAFSGERLNSCLSISGRSRDRLEKQQLGPGRKHTMVQYTTSEIETETHSSSTANTVTSNTPGFTSNAPGRRKARYRRSTSRIDGGGAGYVQYVQGKRLPFAYAILSLSSCLVPEGMGVTLDVLDVTLYWRQNRKERAAIANPYVQYQKSYLGRGWTFKKGVAA